MQRNLVVFAVRFVLGCCSIRTAIAIDRFLIIQIVFGYVERNHAMVLASDFCVFYYNENYLPDMRKASKKVLTNYQPKRETQLAFDFAKAQGKVIINLYTKGA